MLNSRRFSIAIVVCAGILPAACGKSKSKKNDTPATPTPVNEVSNAAVVSATQMLIGRVTLADIAQSTQVTAEFASSGIAAASISSGSQAASAYTGGKALKFSEADPNKLENTAGLGAAGSYNGGGYYGTNSSNYGYSGWNFPIFRGVFGFISNVGSLIFGGINRTHGSYGTYGYGYSSYGYSSNSECGCQSGSYPGNYPPGYEDYYNYDRNNPPFPFGPTTQYSNPQYIWTPGGPSYNNAALNPFPTSGIRTGTTYNTGIKGCTPSTYDETRGWIAKSTPINDSAPLCNGKVAQTDIGPVIGTTYSNGATGCVPAAFDGKSWQPTATSSTTTAPLCDGNVYSNVTSVGSAVNNQMPAYAPVYSENGSSFNYRYLNSFDDSSYRYYIYGI